LSLGGTTSYLEARVDDPVDKVTGRYVGEIILPRDSLVVRAFELRLT
jgi:hypothetical protein